MLHRLKPYSFVAFISVILSALLSNTLFACGLGGHYHELSFLFLDNDPKLVLHMKKLTKQFNEENPDANITFSTAFNSAFNRSTLAKLPSQWDNNGGPDIALISDFSLNAYFLDLTPYIEKPEQYIKEQNNTLLLLADHTDKSKEPPINGYVFSQHFSCDNTVKDACSFSPEGSALVVSKHTKYPIVSAKFLLFLAEKSRQQEIAEKFSLTSAYHFEEPSYQTSNEQLKIKLLLANHARQSIP